MMQTIPVERRAVDAGVLKQTPSTAHVSRVVQSPAIITEGGKPIMYAVNVGVTDALRTACARVKTSTAARTRGLMSTSVSFGTMSRNVFANHCRSASMAREMPAEH